MTKRKQQRQCHVAECNSPISDSVYVCDPCISELDYTLDQFPDLWAELEATLTKQARFSAKSERPSRERPLPFHVSASDIAHRINNTLATWCRVIMEDHACPAVRPDAVNAVLVEWLRDQLGWLQRQKFAAEAVGDIVDEISVIHQIIDRPQPQRYLGPCDCGESLYITGSPKYADCPSCLMLHDVEALQERALIAADDTLAHASLISRAITSLGFPVTPVHISRWVQRGRLLAKGHDKDGKALYRIGDVRGVAQEMESKKGNKNAS